MNKINACTRSGDTIDLCVNCGNCYTDPSDELYKSYRFNYMVCYGQSKPQIETSKIDGTIISKIDGVKMCDSVRGITTKCEWFTTNIHPQVAKLRELDKKFTKHWNYFKLLCVFLVCLMSLPIFLSIVTKFIITFY